MGIMQSWSHLMYEHMTILSQENGPDQLSLLVRESVQDVCQGSNCHTKAITVYVSSEKYTCEVILGTTSQDASFSDVEKVANSVKLTLEAIKDIERVLVQY